MLPTAPFDPSKYIGRSHADPSDDIRQLIGGREFFFKVGARTVHRIGLMAGIGWFIPRETAKNGINYCRVEPGGFDNQTPVYKISLFHVGPGEEPEDVAEGTPVVIKHGVHGRDLRRVFVELSGVGNA